MPRKYRPPASRRRKNRTANIPYESTPAEDNATLVADPAEEAAAEGALEADALDEGDFAEEAAYAGPESASTPVSLRNEPRGDVPKERHVTRDYSYVRGELARIAVLAAVLIVALIIIAIIRN